MIEIVEGFGRDWGRLPGVLKGWDAYKELKLEVDNMAKFLPLVKELSKESINNGHWEEIIKLTQKDIPYKINKLKLGSMEPMPWRCSSLVGQYNLWEGP